MHAVRLRDEAGKDLDAAAEWYERQRTGLGTEFLDEALRAFRAIAARPLAYPVIHRDLRRALMHRFPFGIYFRVETSSVVVLAVIHGSRHPERWQLRK